jgi:hypothetical protein
MTELLLALIALGVFIVAFALFRVANILLTIGADSRDRQREIIEALWAKMGCSREEWRQREREYRLAEFEQKQKDEKTRKPWCGSGLEFLYSPLRWFASGGIMPQTRTLTAHALLLEVVRATLLSRTDESIEGQLFVAAQIQREHASSLRKFPELRQALSVIASGLYRDWLASSEGQYFQLLSSQLSELSTLIELKQVSRWLASSQRTLQSIGTAKQPPKKKRRSNYWHAKAAMV